MTKGLMLAAALVALAIGGRASAQTEPLPLRLLSPDKQLEITLGLGDDGAPVYTVSYAGQQIVAHSTLGLELKHGGLLSKGMKVTSVRRASHDESYDLVVGKTRRARDHCNELVVALDETVGAKRKLELVFRAYDDGAAFRYRLPSQPGMESFEIAGERTQFRFPTDQSVWAIRLGSFTTSYEGEYELITSGRIAPDAVVGLPLLVQTRDAKVTYAIAESNLVDYAGMYFGGIGNGYGVVSRLAPRRDDPSIAVRAKMTADGFATPWRVVMVASEPAKLIESTLVNNLAAPNAIGDTSWIKPGKSAWDWWSGPARVGIENVGMNDATMRHYVDFASKMKLEYMLVDAGWYTKLPSYGDAMDKKADITKSIPEIDIPKLVEYARERNVGVWLWVHWSLVDDQMEAAFPLYEKWGVKGVKIDFMDSDDQFMVDYYHRVLSSAAKHHLLVDLHGAYKPTGLARTYPNYLTQEGVMGAEYNKWSARVTATHNVTLAFTRLLLGPMDYTPGGFRNATPHTFQVKGESPEVMTTRAHGLAMYVVYESPFACVSDNPEAYDGQPGAEFLTVVPTTWDETRAIAGEIGEYVVVARRHGGDWYLGAMSNERARRVRIPLDFLGSGAYDATVYADGPKPTDVTIATRRVANGKVDGADALELELGPSGGAAIRFAAAK